MRYCKSCILPDSRPGLVIESDGTCNACKNSILKNDNINWKNREQAFNKLVKKIKAKNYGYDCLIPVSGGKDSTWQVIKCLEYGLKPLCFTWKPPSRTKLGQTNLNNLISLGVDHIDYSISPKTCLGATHISSKAKCKIFFRHKFSTIFVINKFLLSAL